MREVLIMAYLDYLNNYLSTTHYAEMNGLTEEEAIALVTLGRTVYNHNHPDS